jgi:AcrR family transcriptional regulator
MDDIATAAGVHRTTVYEYFPNRDVLLADVFAREAAEVIRLAGRHIREQPTFPEGLVRAIADGIELTRASTQLGRLLEPATAGHTMHAALASEAWAEQVRTALAAPVRRAIDRGEVRDDAPLDDLLSWIVRVALSVTAEPPAPSTGDIGDILRLFLLPAIAPR